MMKVLVWVMAMGAGVTAASQAAANSALCARAGLGAALVLNTAIVLVGSLLLLAATGGPASLTALPGAPWPHYVAGLCGFAVIASMTFVLPRLGAATALALMVLGQGLMALLIDHFGLWGMRVVSVNGPRLAGVAFLIAGVLLLRR
jgi:transporter family-2 protein